MLLLVAVSPTLWKTSVTVFIKITILLLILFEIWAPMSSQTSKLVSRKNGFNCKGGQFLLGISFKVCIDFNACDGIVEIIWHGRSDFHSIILSTTSLMHIRIGTSIQINKGLVQRMKTLLEMHANGIDINKKV